MDFSNRSRNGGTKIRGLRRRTLLRVILQGLPFVNTNRAHSLLQRHAPEWYLASALAITGCANSAFAEGCLMKDGALSYCFLFPRLCVGVSSSMTLVLFSAGILFSRFKFPRSSFLFYSFSILTFILLCKHVTTLLNMNIAPPDAWLRIQALQCESTGGDPVYRCHGGHFIECRSEYSCYVCYRSEQAADKPAKCGDCELIGLEATQNRIFRH